MANAHEAARHYVQQKATQEFVDLKRHDLPAIVVGIVLPAESDAAVVVIDEPIVGQRDAVRVPPEVLEHLLGASEGPLRIDDPVDGPELTEEATERAAAGQQVVPPAKVSWPASNARCRREVFRAKDDRERADGNTRNEVDRHIHRRDRAPTRRRSRGSADGDCC